MAKTDFVSSNPTSDDELFEYIILKWKRNETADLYYCADEEIVSVMGRGDFAYMFESISKTGGALRGYSNKVANAMGQAVTYHAMLDFDNIYADISLSIRNMKILSFSRIIRFKNEFEIDRGNGIAEKYFILENDGFMLNAVYTYVKDGNARPAALLIAGSGPCDYNETAGLLTPFEDIALGLAENGICSLRVDKRTLGYVSDFGLKSGITEEYFSDCRAAIDYLRERESKGICLIGHSLGGQIAAALAAESSGISGLIIFNSSARHIADIMCEQCSTLEPQNKSSYIEYANAAKTVDLKSASGLYYYGASDYYWASYNGIDTAKNITDAKVKTLIVNSRSDKQIFHADIGLWQALFGNTDNVSIHICDNISHQGYKIDADAPSLYHRSDFFGEILSLFSDFIKERQ